MSHRCLGGPHHTLLRELATFRDIMDHPLALIISFEAAFCPLSFAYMMKEERRKHAWSSVQLLDSAGQLPRPRGESNKARCLTTLCSISCSSGVQNEHMYFLAAQHFMRCDERHSKVGRP